MISDKDERLLRRKDVEEMKGEHPTALDEDIKAGLMTPPIKIGARRVAWPLSEVRALIAARIAGLDDEAIKALVARLVAKRADALRALEGQV